jgi:hypothetical protein
MLHVLALVFDDQLFGDRQHDLVELRPHGILQLQSSRPLLELHLLIVGQSFVCLLLDERARVADNGEPGEFWLTSYYEPGRPNEESERCAKQILGCQNPIAGNS